LCEPALEELGGLGFVAGEEVAVAVEGDGDAGVAHVGAEGFGVDAGGDHVGGVAVAAFVQADRGEAGFLPGVAGVELERAGVERLAAEAVREDEPRPARALLEAVGFGARGAVSG
jgi:hypothetical protein